MRQSFFKNHQQRSPLLQMKLMHASGSKTKGKSLLFNMNLTTLIDAFCILVIFLLANMNGQLQDLKIGKNMTLPAAVQTEVLATGVVVRMEKNEFFIDEQKTTMENIVKTLIDRKTEEKNSLIIQADKNTDYDKISLLLRAGGEAGYEKYAFAVLPGKVAGNQ